MQQSLAVVFRACNDVCVSLSDRFKCFHTADVFAALVLASIWSRNVVVQYKLFGLFAYSAEHRNSFFSYFRQNFSNRVWLQTDLHLHAQHLHAYGKPF